MSTDEERDGVALTNLDQPLFAEAGATKRDLVDYLDAMSDRLIVALKDRPLSVIRVLRGQAPFMQKNLPKYAPDWVPRATMWAEASKRDVSYPLANDRATLLWLANQRAVEYHPALFRVDAPDRPTELVLDIDPPEGAAFASAVAAARLVRAALAEAGLAGAVKTSGAKGLHIVVPIRNATTEQAAAATRALAVRAEQLDPQLATTAFVRDERAGKVFIDSTRAGGATVRGRLRAPASPRRPGVVPGRLGRARRCPPRGLHRAQRGRIDRRGRSVDGCVAGAAITQRRSGRARPVDSDRPGAGHARRQTPRPPGALTTDSASRKTTRPGSCA